MKDLVDVMSPVRKKIVSFRCSECHKVLSDEEVETILQEMANGIVIETEDIICFEGKNSCQEKLRKEREKINDEYGQSERYF